MIIKGYIIMPRKEYVHSIISSKKAFRNIGISILASASQHQHRRHFCLSNFVMKKTSVSPFQVPLQTLLGVLAALYSSYSVENLLVPSSKERNSTGDVISGLLNIHTAKGCILHVCKFLIKNPIRDHFLEIFCKF